MYQIKCLFRNMNHFFKKTDWIKNYVKRVIKLVSSYQNENKTRSMHYIDSIIKTGKYTENNTEWNHFKVEIITIKYAIFCIFFLPFSYTCYRYILTICFMNILHICLYLSIKKIKHPFLISLQKKGKILLYFFLKCKIYFFLCEMCH